MLRHLSADYPEFKSLRFQPGLNLLVADTTPQSTETDSRNGAGKSSMVELLHFLLGSRTDRNHVALHKRLSGVIFELGIDWPHLNSPLVVRRTGSQPDHVLLEPDISSARAGQLFDLTTGRIKIAEWNQLIEAELFHLPAEHPGVSGRTLLSFLIRRVSTHGFNDPIKAVSRQSDTEASTNLSYLLGLDWRLASRYHELKDRETTRTQLKKAVDDPVWGRIVGKPAELRGQITVTESRIRDLEQQIRDFRVVPQYEELKKSADALTRRIQQIGIDDAIDQQNLDQLEAALTEDVDVEIDYLETVYSEVGIVFDGQIRERFSDVRSFHEAVVRNRRTYLSQELGTIRARLASRRAERAALGEEQRHILRRLNEGGALEALNLLQQASAKEEADLGSLRHRLAAAETLEASKREITAQRDALTQEIADDLAERSEQTTQATLLFYEYAQRLYSDVRGAYLVIEPGRSSLKINPRIDDDASRAILNMKIFCFDLAVAVVAHRAGRGPDFLVHDSHLFDGVDDRQIAAALGLAAEVARHEGMQYVASINSDDLAKAENRGFAPAAYVVDPRLRDSYEDGGLFGFRF
ncbi:MULTISPECIES: ABC-three component system protein [Actinoalloteichus]|uniref:DUF2326 domain-containing protein n=1 Tax=Actinoalloteichus fjordicus TaxID=1612552 RepID=A0AAC9L8S0_9PSEU|nr:MULTISPECIES: ABC-three component system protein [Actinoalloteichus]APU13273.1 hypothetical protein UA74_05995 [Actinoalloteichus fjordicus]APU19224.1 hypothetical protein UA75_06000 [Actinoalloteichus sp. GBA129-24]